MRCSLIYTVVCLSLSLIQISRGQSCGARKTSRIVGGAYTNINEFPMMAGLIELPVAQVFCGATILSNYYCLTCAHCLKRISVSSLAVSVGDWNYTTGSDTPYSQLYKVSRFIIHAGHNPNANPPINDIAIIVMANSINFNVAVGPVCLPSSNNLFTNSVVEGVGWGLISFGGPVSTTLQKVQLNVISNAQCKTAYENTEDIQSSHLCTYTQNKDTCTRDSGGPIFAMVNGLVNLVGVIVYGQGCATIYPAVHTRVTSFISWIQQNTNGAVYVG